MKQHFSYMKYDTSPKLSVYFKNDKRRQNKQVGRHIKLNML